MCKSVFYLVKWRFFCNYVNFRLKFPIFHFPPNLLKLFQSVLISNFLTEAPGQYTGVGGMVQGGMAPRPGMAGMPGMPGMNQQGQGRSSKLNVCNVLETPNVNSS